MTRQSLLRSPGVHKVSVFALAMAAVALGLAPVSGTPGPELADSFEASPGPWVPSAVTPNNAVDFIAPSAHPVVAEQPPGAWDGTRALRVIYDGASTAPAAEVAGDFLPTRAVGLRLMIAVPSATVAAMASGDRFRFARLAQNSDDPSANLELWVKKENGAIHVEGGLPGTNPLGSAQLTDIAPDTWHTVMLTYWEPITLTTSEVRLYVDDLQTSRDQTPPSLTLLAPPSGGVAVGLTGAAQGSGTKLVYWLDDVKVSPFLDVGLSAPLIHLQQDGYEAANIGILPPPSGKALVANSGGSVQRIPAGHRGAGMQVIDTTLGSGVSAAYGELIGLDAGRRLYHRAWWHQGPVADGGMHPVMGIGAEGLQGTGPLFNPMAVLQIGPQGVQLTGYSLVGNMPVPDTFPVQPFPLDAGWHLLELMVGFSGTDGGVRTAWVDGRPMPPALANWPPQVHPQRWIDGHPPDVNNGMYVGADEYDDSRTSVQMQPSQFGVFASSSLDAGVCTALSIRAIDSSGGFSPVPEDVRLTYQAYGAGAFYADPFCAAVLPQAASLLVPSGQIGTVASFLPTGSGPARITLSHPDYLSRDSSLFINALPPPDNEPPSTPGQPFFSPTVTNRPVMVTWLGSNDDGGSGLRKYVVEASTNGGSTFATWGSVSAIAPDISAGVLFDGGQAYWTLRVLAEDVAGNRSSPSPDSVQLTMDLTPPGPPSPPPSGTIDGGIATVSWGSATDPQPVVSGIRSYSLSWTSSPPGETGSCPNLTNTTCSFPVTPGHLYALKAHATDRAGNDGVDGQGTLTSVGQVAGLRILGFATAPDGTAYAAQGDPNPVTVEAFDVNGAVVPGYLGTVRFAAEDPGGMPFPASLPGAGGMYTFLAADQGRHDFRPGYTFNAAGDVFAKVADATAASTIAGEVRVTVIAAGQVLIVREANPWAARGVPYRYSATGRVRAVGSQPVTFSTCSPTPDDFLVDAATGAVSWTPSASTDFPVSICVRAQATSGGADDTYQFQVDELPPSSVLPAARFAAAPNPADVGVNVAFDSSNSTWDAALGPPAYRWRFGDGSPLGFRPNPFRGYLLPGGYRPSLVLADGVGRTDQTSRSVQVLDGARIPPIVAILTPPPSGVNALDVSLQARADAGSSPLGPIRWDLGNGASAEGTSASASYAPGRYWATAAAVDQNGLPATDKVEITVARDDGVPPSCAATVNPTFANASSTDAGRATVDWIAWRAPGTAKITSVSWSIDGVAFQGGVVSQQYSTTGWRRGTLTVTGEDGLTCTDQVAMLVLSGLNATAELPPRILDPGVSGPINCKDPYVGRAPIASGTGPLRWSKVDSSQPVTVDGAGVMTWTPVVIPDLDHVTYTLQVTNAAGLDRLAVNVPYTCKRDVSLSTCSCGEGGGAPAAAGLALLALWAASRRRRAAVRVRARRR